jgi:hypothetical protein
LAPLYLEKWRRCRHLQRNDFLSLLPLAVHLAPLGWKCSMVDAPELENRRLPRKLLFHILKDFDFEEQGFSGTDLRSAYWVGSFRWL